MQPSNTKILPVEALVEVLAAWRHAQESIVFTNGCFDLLHPGHIDNLELAKSFGDRLIVGLNADASINRLKGDSRPINDVQFRSRLLAALGCVDAVVIFEEDTPAKLIAAILPDVLVKGGDYTIEEVVGHEVVQAHGGEVKIIPLTAGYSSTKLIKTIRSLGH